MIILFKIIFDLFFIFYSFHFIEQLSRYLLYNIKYFIVCRIYKKKYIQNTKINKK